jgi:hypothetical protein
MEKESENRLTSRRASKCGHGRAANHRRAGAHAQAGQTQRRVHGRGRAQQRRAALPELAELHISKNSDELSTATSRKQGIATSSATSPDAQGSQQV